MNGASTPMALLAGPQIIGMFFNWGLQTVLSVQDSIPLKVLVYGTLCFEWVQTGLMTADAFDIYVYGYGDITAMLSYHSTWFSVPIMSGFIAAIVQIFFAWRIYMISRSRIMMGVIVLCAIGQFAIATVDGVLLFKSMAGSAGSKTHLTPIISASLATSAFVDVLIAIVMTRLLFKARTGIAHSDDVVNRLIQLVIETGTLTATVDIIYMVLLIASPSDTLLYQCPSFFLAKLYANTLLVNLNNRAFMRRGQTVIDSSAANGSGFGSRSYIGFQLDKNADRVREDACTVHVDVLRESHPSDIPLENPQFYLQKGTYGGFGTPSRSTDLEDRKADPAASV
ncbi:hypothetical protein B0H21DRAFT_824746 [Amylocystis lapponica]|nr:hypothetical protein B0H21DRAFT_824746 [Amylocystis lapponica]